MVLNQETDEYREQKMGADNETTVGTVTCSRRIHVFDTERDKKVNI